jgi:prepilin-type N-terminal cleavage/methylation domain-containing protein
MPDTLTMKKNRGFTLLEMLAAMTVLTIVLYIVVQITHHASIMAQGTRRMDADSESRLVFNRLALDFAHMLKRGDLDYSAFKQPNGAQNNDGNDHLAFFAEVAGSFTSGTPPDGREKSPVSLVAYKIAPADPANPDPNLRAPGLQRMNKGLGWEQKSSQWDSVIFFPLTLIGSGGNWPDLLNTNDGYQILGHQVFRLEYTYLLKSTAQNPARLSATPWDTDAGHSSINGLTDIAAIVVTIGVLDETSRKIVAEADYPRLIARLADVGDNETAAAKWNNAVNSPGFSADTGIPPPAAGRVRIYERYFYLSGP